MSKDSIITRKANALPTLEGTWQPRTVDEESRTVEVIFTTGADVVQGTFDRHVERLRVDERSVNLERFKNGAPVLDSHQLPGLRHQIGVVEDAWISDKRGMARVRFSKRADVEPIWRDIVDGVIRHVSVGYTRDRVLERDEKIDGLSVREVTRWTPHELSFVSVPADHGAQVRKVEMDPENEGIRSAPAGTPPPATEDAEKAERTRATEILTLCERTKLGSTFARSLIADGLSLSAAREAVVDAIAERDAGPELRTQIMPGDGTREAGFTEIAVRALQHRAGFAQTDDRQALALAHRGVIELTRRAAEMDGIHIPEHASNTEVWRRALTSQTLGDVVALTASRSITRGYDAEPRVFTEFARRGSASNFRDIERVKISDAPKLDLVPEGKNYPLGELSDSKETFRLATYAKIIMYTRQLWVNDDLSALTRIPQMLGAAAAATENDVFWAFVNGNPVMSDTFRLFDSAERGNIVYSTALNATTVEAARAHFRNRETENKVKLNLTPRYLVVGFDLETTAEKLLAPPAEFQTGTIGDTLATSLRNSLVLIVEPRVPAGVWYLFADVNRIDHLEYAYLQDQNGPMVGREVDFSSDAVLIKIVNDFGVGAIDWRGAYQGSAAAAP